MRGAWIVAVGLGMAGGVHAQVNVFAAGSLRAPLTQAAQAFEAAQPGERIALTFGASGLLRERIAKGEAADVFASANMEHPQALAAAGGWGAARVFTRNALCALARPQLGLTPDNLVGQLLKPEVRVGTSTPKADPSGDYAFEMFARIGAGAGAPPAARQALEGKALQLTGGPNSPPPPAGRNVYGVLVAEGQADVFITYCTNAVAAVAEHPQLQMVSIPAGINVGADYGLTVGIGAAPRARAFADFVLSAAGRQLLARHGFLPPAP